MKRARLALLKRQFNAAVKASQKAHATWHAAYVANKWPARHNTWVAWQKTVKRCTQLSQQINALQFQINHPVGATHASLAGAKAIGAWEGGRSADGLFHPYRDVVGVWTIGYGHTAGAGAPFPGPGSRPLSGVEAATLLLHDLNVRYAPALAAAFKRGGWKHQTQKEFDAGTSFLYNLGTGLASTGNSFGNAIATKDARGAANALLLFDHAGGQRLPGLTRRRQWERQLFLGGTYNV